MLNACLILISCQLIGELLREAFHLPVPGTVIGMFLLAAGLVLSDRGAEPKGMRGALERLSHTLISWMGLFFVPAGAGLIAQLNLLKQGWLPILSAVVGSTVLSIAATGLTMHFTSSPARVSLNPKREDQP
jgi:holin-like protein